MTNIGVIRLFARLRWLMLRGVLRSGGAQVAAAVVGVVGSVVIGVGGALAAFAIGRSADDVVAVFVVGTTVAVVIVVMIGVIAGVAQPVDPRVLATEPLGERQLGVGLLAASATGPPGLAALLVGVGLFAGVVRDPLSIVPATIAVVTLLASLLLVSRTTINSLGLLATRLPRVGQIVVGVSTLVFYLAFQVIPRVLVGIDDAQRDRLAAALAWTPTGQLGRAVATAGSDPAASIIHSALGAIWLIPLLLLFTWTTRRLVTSVRGGVPKPTGTRARRRPVRAIARAACGDGAVGATAWRGVLTRFRTPRSALETFTAAGLGLGIILVPVLASGNAGPAGVLAGGAVQFAVLFMAGNSFGSDGPAMANELLTGVDPSVLVTAKARAVVIAAAPLAIVGPTIAAGVTGVWNYLPAGIAIGVGAMLAGVGAAMVQSSVIPIAIPESDNPLAGGDSGKGIFAGLVFFAVLLVLGVMTLPVALALLWAIDQGSAALVAVLSGVTLGGGWLVMRAGVIIAASRWRDRGPELYAAIVPTR
jgi:hypothetical protein